MATRKVGDAIAAALARGEELRSASPRKLRVRIMTEFDDVPGLAIHARIAARTNEELRAQLEAGTRHVAWAELDARAGDLVSLVEEVVAEVEAAVESAPPPPPRPSTGAGCDVDAFEALKVAFYRAMTLAATREMDQPEAGKLSSEASSEAAMAAALKFAALAAYKGNVSPDEVMGELRLAIGEVRTRAQKDLRPPSSRVLHS